MFCFWKGNSMKRFFWLAVVLIFLGSGIYLLTGISEAAPTTTPTAQAAAASQESLSVELLELTHTMPDVLLSGEYPFQVTLNNPHEVPLVAKELSSSCGCVKVRMEPKTIPAKGKAELKGVYVPQGRPGTFSKTIGVAFENRPMMAKVTLTGKQASRFPAEPEEIRLEADASIGTEAKVLVKLTNDSKKEVTFQIVGEKAKLATCWLPTNGEKKLAPGKSVELELRQVEPSFIAENIDLVLATSLAEEPIRKLTVRVLPKEYLRVNPPAVRFGNIRKSDLAKKRIQLQLIGNALQSFTIDRIEAPGFLNHEAISKVDKDQLQLTFTPMTANLQQQLHGEIQVHLKTPDGRISLVRIPVSGLVRDME